MAYTFPVISLGDIILHTLVGRLNNQTTMTTFLYELLGTTLPAPTIDTACSTFDAALEAAGNLHSKYRAAMPTNWTGIARWTQVISPTRYIKFVTADTRVGTGLGIADSSNIAAVYERRAGLSGRPYVGTVHLPCPTVAASLDSGNLTNAQKIVTQDVATQNSFDVITTGGQTWTPVLFRRPKLIPPTPARITLIHDCFVQNTVRVMRRRTVGRGI